MLYTFDILEGPWSHHNFFSFLGVYLCLCGTSINDKALKADSLDQVLLLKKLFMDRRAKALILTKEYF